MAGGAGRATVRIFGMALLLLLATAAPGRAAGEYRTAEVESLRIVIDSEWASRIAPGHLPVRFDITNLGDARVIEIVGQGSRFLRVRGMVASSFGVRQSVRLSRGDRVRLTLPVPVYADSESIRLEIREDGRTLERFNFVSWTSRLPADNAAALVVAEPGSEFALIAGKWLRTVSGSATVTGRGGMVAAPTTGPRPPASQPLDFILPPARIPSEWLGFTTLRAVVIGPREWEQLTDPQRDALLTWTACGGDLLVVDGDVSALFAPGQAPPAAVGPARAYFFGRIHTPTSESISTGGLAAALAAAAVVQDPDLGLPANRAASWGAIAGRGFRVPIPGVAGVPARAYLLILVAFSILIGPVNFWLMWRMRQQVLVVLTTPILSALFIILLGGYVLAGEGIGVRGRAMSITMLDQARRQAATRASVSLYAAGMAPRGGLRFGRDEAVYPVGRDGLGNRDSHLLDLTDAQAFTAGVIHARSPTNFEYIGFRAARERLEIDRSGGTIQVLNGLAGTVRALIYSDGATVYHLADPLGAGQRATLKPGALAVADRVPAGLPLSSRFEHLLGNPPPGAYLALLDRSPFWNAGVSGLDERDSVHLVVGWVGGQP